MAEEGQATAKRRASLTAFVNDSAPKDGRRMSALNILDMTAHGLEKGFDPELDEDDPLLASLKRSTVKQRNPASAKWDGRVSGMSLQEYRERKWSVDACYAKVERRGPSFSMRRSLPASFTKKNNNFQVGDVFRAFDATLSRSPSYTCGLTSFLPPKETSPGPSEYKIKSTMDPARHPTSSKHTGPRFGTEVLEPRDPPGPAPGDYDPSVPLGAQVCDGRIKSQPNFTIQGREAWRAPTAAPGPGVGEYDVFKAMRTGKITTINWTHQGKTDPEVCAKTGKPRKPLGSKQYVGPGPDHYKPPGHPDHDDSFAHPQKKQLPQWKFGTESRGLRN
jgi:hypothetical protein